MLVRVPAASMNHATCNPKGVRLTTMHLSREVHVTKGEHANKATFQKRGLREGWKASAAYID